jgi:hypothetical protein
MNKLLTGKWYRLAGVSLACLAVTFLLVVVAMIPLAKPASAG